MWCMGGGGGSTSPQDPILSRGGSRGTAGAVAARVLGAAGGGAGRRGTHWKMLWKRRWRQSWAKVSKRMLSVAWKSSSSRSQSCCSPGGQLMPALGSARCTAHAPTHPLRPYCARAAPRGRLCACAPIPPTYTLTLPPADTLFSLLPLLALLSWAHAYVQARIYSFPERMRTLPSTPPPSYQGACVHVQNWNMRSLSSPRVYVLNHAP